MTTHPFSLPVCLHFPPFGDPCRQKGVCGVHITHLQHHNYALLSCLETTAQAKHKPHGECEDLGEPSRDEDGLGRTKSSCKPSSGDFLTCIRCMGEGGKVLLDAHFHSSFVPLLTMSPVTRGHKGGLFCQCIFCFSLCPQPCAGQSAALTWLFPSRLLVRSGRH